MRELAGLFRFLLSLVIFVGAVNLAFVLAEAYWVSGGRFQPGQTIEYLERPARALGELVAISLGILAVTCLAAFANWRLKRWQDSLPEDDETPAAPGAEASKSTAMPGADSGK